MINVKIDSFEGPLDLLLHLIENSEVDIYDISVVDITEQYVAYIDQMQQLELEIASEFLVMAATLLALKSRMLLPKQEEISFQSTLEMDMEEMDPREELIQRLVEYKKFKELALHLRNKEADRSQIFTRPAENLSIFIDQEESNPVANVSLFDLLNAFEKILQTSSDPPSAKVDREEWSIGERMGEIRRILHQKSRIGFTQLMSETKSKEQLIVTLLALLELMKRKEIYCEQPTLFTNIWISKRLEEKLDGEGY